jgi:hypothetical protein
MRKTLLWRGGVLLDGDVGSYASFLLAGTADTADEMHKSVVKVITVGLCICSLRFGTCYPEHGYQLPRRRKRRATSAGNEHEKIFQRLEHRSSFVDSSFVDVLLVALFKKSLKMAQKEPKKDGGKKR